MVSPISHVQCWDGCTSLANVRRCIRNGHPVLVLMRGVPGSGKSFLARSIFEQLQKVYYEQDSHLYYSFKAVRHHYEIYFVEPETEWKHTPEICAL
uniref:Zeta_toxin domain-containing protein n=1 Tax=Syphacia muris TaxID=451379 RepID=A0A0N5AKZ9_9BILA